MKKIMSWIFAFVIIVFVIDWGVMGIKLLENEYDIMAEAVIGLICIIIMFVCGVYKAFSSKCPHCGKLKLTDGEYCPHCGKKL